EAGKRDDQYGFLVQPSAFRLPAPKELLMEFAFYFSAGIAVVSTLRVITGSNPVHALLYLVISLLAVSMCFFSLGAPFAGALEIIVCAGAIMVLFVFVVMMLNLGPATAGQERAWMKPGV